ncbi:MAG: LptF/LptG family permease [Candidatus Krumholzibacteriia bacterium]
MFLGNLLRALGVLVVAVATVARGGWPQAGAEIGAFLVGLVLRALPVALLVATLLTVGFLARNGELTALAAAGQSLARTVRPLLLTGLGAAIAVAGLTAAGLPGTPDSPHAALTNLLAVLVGAPLAAVPRRATRYGGFLTALGVYVTYVVTAATAQTLGRHGLLPPIVATWLPPAAFFTTAATLWRPFLHRR